MDDTWKRKIFEIPFIYSSYFEHIKLTSVTFNKSIEYTSRCDNKRKKKCKFTFTASLKTRGFGDRISNIACGKNHT